MEPDVGGSNPPSCTKTMNKKTFKPTSELPNGFANPLGNSLVGLKVFLFIVLVQLGGFEPPTSGSTNQRSNQLSYSCIIFFVYNSIFVLNI